ncbi:CBS domain-containing protein [Amorphus sp. 3PC139-8]|uniref:CBS domain-containing protein n=1 Tax=Amorphus sp. 3PC139-8 TaxID=2735676 RepID=UPI00345DD7D2
MRISEIMTRGTAVADPNDTARAISQRMVAEDLGYLPVGEQDRLVGSITDRDIMARVVAEGRGADCSVGDVMTKDVKYCFEEDDVDQVMRNMANTKVRRMPVVNSDKRLVGIVSLADGASEGDPSAAGDSLGKLRDQESSYAD